MKDDDLDNLFRLPLDQFTAARNALAKARGGSGAAEIRELSKPPVAAWAVNQLYWRDRKTYDALMEAAEAVRKAHKAVLAGRAADLRAAGREHDKALDAALKATVAILTGEGHPASDATRQAVVSTLRALPGDEPPGRLTGTLQPGGFEALAGFPVAARSAGTARAAKARGGAARVGALREAPSPSPSASRARAAAAEALRRAEHEAKREEFERARAVREADKAAKAVERAREALDRAQRELEEAEEAEKKAAREREAAEKRARAAEEKLAALKPEA